jgi:hypothetical protein
MIERRQVQSGHNPFVLRNEGSDVEAIREQPLLVTTGPKKLPL